MQNIKLNTGNAKTRNEALNIITNNMNNTLCHPLAYMFDQSGCSCCRSEYFYLICKIKNEYKIFCYNGYINHTKDCAIMRCSCNEQFSWKNIDPIEINYDNDNFNFNTFTSIKDNTWYDDCFSFFEQQKENNNIFFYNENDNCDILHKNYKFYF
jgi:hypothetical protein